MYKVLLIHTKCEVYRNLVGLLSHTWVLENCEERQSAAVFLESL